MLVLHANWNNGALHWWGESLTAYQALKSESPDWQLVDSTIASSHRAAPTAVAASPQPCTTVSRGAAHSFACTPDMLREALCSLGVAFADVSAPDAAHAVGVLKLRLPCDAGNPWPSDRLARMAGDVEWPVDPVLREFEIPAIKLDGPIAVAALLRIEDAPPFPTVDCSHSVRYWIAVANFVVDLLADQRVIPTLSQIRKNGLKAAWRPWLHDADVRARVAALLHAMPPVVRAVARRGAAAPVDHDAERLAAAQPWPILEDALSAWTDAIVRQSLAAESFADAIADRDPTDDPHVAWLSGLLDWNDSVRAPEDGGNALLRDATRWINRLDETDHDQPLHLCLKLNEPQGAGIETTRNREIEKGDASSPWVLSLHLQVQDDPEQLIDASDIWNHSATSAFAAGRRVDHPQELLLAQLGRASRIYPKLESALAQKHPERLNLTTAEAYEFLREFRPLLDESGISVIAPPWWDQPIGRLAARLHIDAPPASAMIVANDSTATTASMLGLNSLVKFSWQIAIGDQPLSSAEFKALSQQTAPLVQIRGQWIEISPEQLAGAREFLEKTPAGETTLLEAIQMANGGRRGDHISLPVLGMDATGWVADLLSASSESHRMPLLDQPPDFIGALRPYQKTGLSWLAFLDHFGLGACLADDMGLGKTIQLIALLLHERRGVKAWSDQGIKAGTRHQASGTSASCPVPGASMPPTLLIVPTSVVGNWVRELGRFSPSLKVHVHHGPERTLGDRFVDVAAVNDVVITTYPLVSRDIETLNRLHWHRVALDEAQYIKNPPTKQTTAIRSLHAPRRLALTGTPVENRLSELWSIMEFCNPGYLGPAGEFRRRFAVPVERHRNRQQADRLRLMVRPFILRRVKTDPNVIDDLPPCTETKEFATLTVEQAAMYQKTVNAMLNDVDRASGIQRRGLVLATLVKLKQICNHPEQGRANDAPASSFGDQQPQQDDSLGVQLAAPKDISGLSARSGKAKRLMVILEEVIASGGKALIFTQFRQMGHLLTAMIQNDLDCQALFLHGGTPAGKRQHLVDRFQDENGGVPIFVLSLKAGGLGLNLTAANHVFHYDRWWNPAVENQATDRAFRIGQMRAVHVHKFVCMGTLEERIDQMIEQKTELAQNIIGSGEQWLTELSTGQLHDLLMLRPSSMETDS